MDVAAWEKGWQPRLRLFPSWNRRPKPPSGYQITLDTSNLRVGDLYYFCTDFDGVTREVAFGNAGLVTASLGSLAFLEI